ncbi:MAG: hypothetical protein ACLKAK_07090 [Alkaliphilus sp.]
MTTEIEYVYKKDKDFVDMFVTGLYGGNNPHKTLSFYMYNEVNNFPKNETIEFSADGKIIDSKIEWSEAEKLRIVKCLVNVPIDLVPSFAKWMMSHYNTYVNQAQNNQVSSKVEVDRDESK